MSFLSTLVIFSASKRDGLKMRARNCALNRREVAVGGHEQSSPAKTKFKVKGYEGIRKGQRTAV